MWQIWLIASGIFFVIEIFTIGFFVFWLGVGALIAMIFSFFISNIIAQMSIFVFTSALLIFATRPLANKLLNSSNVSTNVYSLVGKTAIVVEEINYSTGKGQVKIDGEVWSAKTNNNLTITKDSEVKILEIDGVKLIVEPLKVSSKESN